MKQELPQGVVYGGIGIVALAVVVFFAMQWFGGGPGNMSADDVKRAEMQAQAGNARLGQYIGSAPGTPGAAPAAPGGMTDGQGNLVGEAAARAAHGGGSAPSAGQ